MNVAVYLKTIQMKKISIIVIIVFFIGTVIFLLSQEKESILGNGYYYLSLEEAIDVGYPGGAIIYKSTQQNYLKDIKITGNVMEVEHNEKYIIAMQQKVRTYREFHSGIKKQYYIIDKTTDIVYGPYTMEEYKKKKKELKVPNNINLESETQ